MNTAKMHETLMHIRLYRQLLTQNPQFREYDIAYVHMLKFFLFTYFKYRDEKNG